MLRPKLNTSIPCIYESITVRIIETALALISLSLKNSDPAMQISFEMVTLMIVTYSHPVTYVVYATTAVHTERTHTHLRPSLMTRMLVAQGPSARY